MKRLVPGFLKMALQRLFFRDLLLRIKNKVLEGWQKRALYWIYRTILQRFNKEP